MCNIVSRKSLLQLPFLVNQRNSARLHLKKIGDEDSWLNLEVLSFVIYCSLVWIMCLPCTAERGRPEEISKGRGGSSWRTCSDGGPRTSLLWEKPTPPAAVSEELGNPSSTKSWEASSKAVAQKLCSSSSHSILCLWWHFHWGWQVNQDCSIKDNSSGSWICILQLRSRILAYSCASWCSLPAPMLPHSSLILVG